MQKETKTPKSMLKATAEYHAKHLKRVPINLNDRTDRDIIEHLNSISNVQGYIKELIRKDINKTVE